MTGILEGRAAVGIARQAIEAALSTDPPKDPAGPFRTLALPDLFDVPRGVFVTLTEHPGGDLRGCIGFPVPVYPLRAAIPRVAVAAAIEDPRFPPLRRAELGRTAIEVSLLTLPQPIDVADPLARPGAVHVGRDGLIVDTAGASGLLLPQVATEQGWDAETFLAETCRKAGLRTDAWRSPKTRFRTFQAEIYHETAPGAAVVARADGA
ncbi:MAG: TIGR00296 family protein [Thermoplasmata archaeon]|nr:TIGR00296 family protein [Thermoplasmata archaeon]